MSPCQFVRVRFDGPYKLNVEGRLQGDAKQKVKVKREKKRDLEERMFRLSVETIKFLLTLPLKKGGM